MAPHIVSWGPGWNEVKISQAPIVSSADTLSVIPIESLLSDPCTKPPIILDAWRARTLQPGASFLGVGTGESETPDGSRQKSEDSFPRHSKYFFKDGNVTFLVRLVVWPSPLFTDKLQVDGFLYRVHLYFFCRDSVYFSTRFAQLGVRDHEASSIIVSLGDVECKDFEAFLSVLYPQ
jgi:hypothetical protein